MLRFKDVSISLFKNIQLRKDLKRNKWREYYNGSSLTRHSVAGFIT